MCGTTHRVAVRRRMVNKSILTYSTALSPSSEANRFSANQEIPRNLGNPKVH